MFLIRSGRVNEDHNKNHFIRKDDTMKKLFFSPLHGVATSIAFLCLVISARADTVYVVNGGATIEQFTTNGVGSVFAIPSLWNVESFASDRAGNLYVVNYDAGNTGSNTIEKFTTNGVASIFAEDDGNGTILNDIAGMACDTNGILYVANDGNDTIEKFDTNGVASIFVADDGSGTILSGPEGLAFDSAGNLYVANDAGFGSDFIEEFAPSGTHKTFATDPGDGSVLNSPNALAIDSSGNLYVANEMENSTIEKFTPNGTPSTFVSSGLSDAEALAIDTADNLYVLNVSGDLFASSVIKFDTNGDSSTFGAVLFDPSNMAFDNAGNLFVVDFNVIKEFAADGGSPNFAFGSIYQPEGLALDSAGNLYLANLDDAITKLTTNGTAATFGVSLSEPIGLGFDSAGNLYVANSYVNTISKITTNGDLSLFASDPGDGSVLNNPQGVAVDSSGNVYVTSTQSIEKFTSNGTNSVFASITNGGFGPGLAFDKAGNLYAEIPAPGPAFSKIEKYAPNGNSTVFTNDPGDGSILNKPEGMAFDSAGNLYVVNSGNNTIEKFATNGIASVFAADPGDGSILSGPTFIAIQPGLSLSAATASPILFINQSGTNVILSWLVAAGSFNLESITNLSGTNWMTVSKTPATIGSDYVVTNGIGGSTRFFRLKSVP
jgi:DNA-binding beta-propeller fold protein YncE